MGVPPFNSAFRIPNSAFLANDSELNSDLRALRARKLEFNAECGIRNSELEGDTFALDLKQNDFYQIWCNYAQF